MELANMTTAQLNEYKIEIAKREHIAHSLMDTIQDMKSTNCGVEHMKYFIEQKMPKKYHSFLFKYFHLTPVQ